MIIALTWRAGGQLAPSNVVHADVCNVVICKATWQVLKRICTFTVQPNLLKALLEATCESSKERPERGKVRLETYVSALHARTASKIL